MKDNDDIASVRCYLDGKMTRKESEGFWVDVAAKKETRTLFYIVLIERWNARQLTPEQKDLAVKLYKESTEFRELYDLSETLRRESSFVARNHPNMTQHN